MKNVLLGVIQRTRFHLETRSLNHKPEKVVLESPRHSGEKQSISGESICP